MMSGKSIPMGMREVCCVAVEVQIDREWQDIAAGGCCAGVLG